MTFRDVLVELGIDFAEGPHRHISQGWYGVRPCPGCSSNEYHLGFPESGAFASCWRCGSQTTAWTLAQMTGLGYEKVKALLKDAGAGWDEGDFLSVPKGKFQLPPDTTDLLPIHECYLFKRGIVPEAAVRLWGVKATGRLGNPPWSIVIPIHHNGVPVSWTTRRIGESASSKRYISARPEQEAEPIKRCLYGADLARNAVVVFEGPMTCLRVGPGAVCTFGIDYTQAQVARIAKFPVRAIAFDPEPEAQAQARRLERELRCFPGRTYLAELESPDGPAWPSDDEVKELRRRFLT